jgi:hypothetical protein
VSKISEAAFKKMRVKYGANEAPLKFLPFMIGTLELIYNSAKNILQNPTTGSGRNTRMATDTPKSVSGFVGFQSLKNFYVGFCRNLSVFCRFFCRIFVGLQFLFSYKK